MMLRLQSMQEFHEVESIDHVRDLISHLVDEDGAGAFWLHRDGACELALFLNGSLAAVYRNTDGAWSHTPGNPEDEYAQFMLENGQIDDFPLSQCVSVSDGIAAFLETADSEALSTRIAWD